MTNFHNARGKYRNFRAAIYATMYDVQRMSDLKWLEESFSHLSLHIKVNKVYLETHRDTIIADEATIHQAKKYFEEQGVQTSGGITYTINERNRFQTYCYTTPEQRQKVKEIAEYTARLFDEFILDDFFFTNCKCEQCIAAKGDLSWTDYRLALMTDAATNLIIEPARVVNPDVKIIIKYPNWYEHFQGLGFNLETEPEMFDALYTGTETRDPVIGQQHLQAYHGYSIVRYFENLKPEGNAGGWVDPFASRQLDRYAEQLWLTLFAKAPEITLFNYTQIQRQIEESHRGMWQGTGTSFDFDAMLAPWTEDGGKWSEKATIALAAGYSFEQVDKVLGELGTPVGLKSYRPYHATGEDYLHSYMGMLGIPIDLRPEFPTDDSMIFLTESAKHDAEIVAKIKKQLVDGKSVVVTSGLFKALQDRGIRDIVEMTVTDRKASIKDYQIGWFGLHHSESAILVPRIEYMNNDSWEEISGQTNTTGTPILHSASYANGVLYVLTIPDNFDDLYKLPVEVLARIREILLRDIYVRTDSPAQVMLFAYDNSTFILESILPDPVEVKIITDSTVNSLQDLQTDEFVSDAVELVDWRRRSTGEHSFEITLKPHSYRVFRFK